MKFKKLVFFASVTVFFIFAGVLLFLFTIALTDFRPEKKIILTDLPRAKVLTSDTVEILTWNIGYAGLDCDMDFFYDGGKKTRTGKAETLKNLDSISLFLSNCTADFIFLQEVDKKSKRTYKIDQVSAIAAKLPLHTAIYATNYKVLYVPMPLNSPLGTVESGIMTFCRNRPLQNIRYAYPAKQPWLKKMFLLDRCFILSRLALKNGKQLVLINTHNSAFDSRGEQRNEEMNFLKTILLDEYRSGNHVIVAGDWNQTPPIESAAKFHNIGTEYFTPLAISPDFMPPDWTFASDGKATNRFVDMSYIKGVTKETLIDFFLLSPNVKLLNVKCIDKNYRNSDHNPVTGRFLLEIK